MCTEKSCDENSSGNRHAHQGRAVQACLGSLLGRQVAAGLLSSEDCGVAALLHGQQDCSPFIWLGYQGPLQQMASCLAAVRNSLLLLQAAAPAPAATMKVTCFQLTCRECRGNSPSSQRQVESSVPGGGGGKGCPGMGMCGLSGGGMGMCCLSRGGMAMCCLSGGGMGGGGPMGLPMCPGTPLIAGGGPGDTPDISFRLFSAL